MTGQLDVARHHEPVELGQRFTATAVEMAAQFDLLAAARLVGQRAA